MLGELLRPEIEELLQARNFAALREALADLPAAETMLRRHAIDREDLTLSRLVGTVEIVGCRPCTAVDAEAACVPAELLVGKQAWCLANPVRLEEPLQPRFVPYGVWFYPFKRRHADRPGRGQR